MVFRRRRRIGAIWWLGTFAVQFIFRGLVVGQSAVMDDKLVLEKRDRLVNT